MELIRIFAETNVDAFISLSGAVVSAYDVQSYENDSIKPTIF